MRIPRSVALTLTTLIALLGLSTTAQAAKSARADRGERAIVRQINKVRAHNGLPGVRVSGRLGRAADHHSGEMLAGDFFAHESRNGGSFDKRVRRYARYRMVGENLAMVSRCGRGAARRIVGMWMQSSAHRGILLTRGFARVGIGRRTGSLGGQSSCVVTADFGG